jgi:hypothetical protein
MHPSLISRDAAAASKERLSANRDTELELMTNGHGGISVALHEIERVGLGGGARGKRHPAVLPRAGRDICIA